MKLPIGTTALAAFCLGFSFSTLLHGAEPGKLHPYPPDNASHALQLPDLGGHVHRLSDYRGKVVLVNFWASWCAPCLAEMPSMLRLKDALRERPFAILAVNYRESKSKVWKFRKLLKLDFATLLDDAGEVTDNWGIEVFPTSYLVDTEGRIRYRVIGAMEWDQAETVTLIESLLGETAPSPVTALAQVKP